LIDVVLESNNISQFCVNFTCILSSNKSPSGKNIYSMLMNTYCLLNHPHHRFADLRRTPSATSTTLALYETILN